MAIQSVSHAAQPVPHHQVLPPLNKPQATAETTKSTQVKQTHDQARGSNLDITV